ncbi:hypothetical protein [Gimesia sp.]|uniref:hypothetical protein n=1 Tax=Gimesia sp. TaxID=2024833 RepID=UPI0025BD982A|nr:hypothetical protein [Gimesia sp.]|tara:strand:+ start:30416 stop:30577 length:162 start_codon:yes stop_codon:yes gene_type:complete
MSNAELLTDESVESTRIEAKYEVRYELEVDHRSQEMLLVLNEVFDSFLTASNS